MFLIVSLKCTVRSPVSVKTYKGGSKEESMLEKNLVIFKRPYLHKRGPFRPESLHAESQWVGKRVHRSEQGDLTPCVVHGSPSPHKKGGRDHGAVSASQT